MRSMDYCTGLFVWVLEVCTHLVVGGVCVAEVRGGGLRCWGLCVFVIKSLRRLWVFRVVVSLGSGIGCVLRTCSLSGVQVLNLHTGRSLTENTIPDAVLVQFDLLTMSTELLETCRGL